MAYVILPHTPLFELDQGQVIGSTLGWQSLVADITYCFHRLSNYNNITLPD